MRKLFVLFFLVFSLPAFAQGNTVKENLSRIFISIPDTFFSPLEHQQPAGTHIDKTLRKSLIDTLIVIDHWHPPLHFTVFDTVHAYLKLMAKTGDPEGMTSEIAYWDRTDGKRLVMMTINYSDMCVYKQDYKHFWIDDGKQLTPVNESEVLPPLSQNDFISAAFLKKHKKAVKAAMPYMILHSENENTISYEPAFDYLFSCGEYFESDPWFGLGGDDIVVKEKILYWDGNKFSVKRMQ